MALSENLDTFFATTDFGESATFTLADTTTITTNVIFTDESEGVNVFESQIERQAAVLSCPAANLPGVRRGDSVTVRSTTYTIERIEQDGIGTNDYYLRIT